MFAAFFKCPLLGGEQAERELNAVESEFELNRKDDDCRLSQVMSFTCGMDGNAPIMGKEYPKYAKEEEGSDATKKAKKPFHPFAKVISIGALIPSSYLLGTTSYHCFIVDRFRASVPLGQHELVADRARGQRHRCHARATRVLPHPLLRT